MGGKRLFYILALAPLLVILSAFPGAVVAQAQDATGAEPAPAETGEGSSSTPTGILDEVVVTRTSAPTATPGVLTEEIENLTEAVGLGRTTFLGLPVSDWANLGLSLLLVALGYLLGTWLIRGPLPRIARRTPSEFDDRLLEIAGPDVRWLVVILVLQFSTIRLSFLSAWLKDVLSDVYFVLGVIVATRIILALIRLADEWYRGILAEQGRLGSLDPVLVLLERVSRILAVLIALIALLSHFGVNVSALAALLGLGGLAFSLAARDTIADAIAGFIILVDRPFRIGDRIEIQEVGTWGDVVDIGLRTTRIRTRDNRLVIVPNSTIGSNQVINYTYPDPRYRVETHVGVAYGTDIETARRIIVDAVRQVEGVLADKPVDALYIEMGDSAMIFRVRWWIESYADTRRMFDKIHTVLQHVLDDAGVESPYPTRSIRLQLRGQDAGSLSDKLGRTGTPDR